ERLNQLRAIYPQASLAPQIETPASYAHETWSSTDAMVEIMRGRLDGLGPVTVAQLAASFALPHKNIDQALARLEGEGFAMQGQFTPVGTPASPPANSPDARAPIEWCSRR